MIAAVSGAIYVIGGYGGGTDYNDVWASTDGGARAGLGRGAVGGYTGWVLRGVLRGTKGTTWRYCMGTFGVLGEY